MPVVSVSMPEELLEQLDAHAAAHEYTGRSEVVRESARSLLTEFEDGRFEDRPLVGTVSVRYDFGTPRVERRVTELRHEFDTAVAANDHSHVDDYCLDLFVLEAELEEISSFVGKLRAVDGVGTVDYLLVPLDSVGQLPEN
ncbi:CopG family ribbon-helix-helix protein [Natronococcus wangiae]|uniref:CopG family ribbon-helix-helix protein n=1 Tax=Natronococcus wangiae TaxID=3068275 RepID=UPI00273E46C1|nr:CopG family ribbon-helix-helix protein [Natronococcus sp. AD5]